MRCLTLHQPWASLVAVGAKTIETRPWRTRHRGQLLIHASAADTDQHMHEHPAAWDALGDVIGGDAPPHGKVVAVAQLVDCVPINSDHRCDLIGFSPYHDDWPGGHEWHGRGWGLTKIGGALCVTRSEMAFGDYRAGRWAWLLDDIRPLLKPVPARGRQGLWTPSYEEFARIGDQIEAVT